MNDGRKQHRQLAALMRRAQGGDRAAFEELYAITAQAQYFTMVGKVGAEAAADLLQELYLVAWKNIGSIHPDALIGYLNATTRNLCRRHLNRQSTSQAPTPYSDEYLEDNQTDRGPLFGAESLADPAIGAADRDQVAHLAAALHSELDDQEREAVLLRFYQGLKLDEVAAALDVSKATVKRIIARALDKLRAKLGMLPMGAALPQALAQAVEGTPAPGALLRKTDGPRAAGEQSQVAERLLAGVAVVAAVGLAALGLGASMPQPETVIADDPRPTAAPAQPEAGDTTGPELVATSTEGGLTVLTVADPAGVAAVTCEGADGTVYEPLATPGNVGASEWRFALPDGTYIIHATDTLGNRSTGTVTVRSVPDPLDNLDIP